MTANLSSFTDILGDIDEITNSQPISTSSSQASRSEIQQLVTEIPASSNKRVRPNKRTGQHGDLRSTEEIDSKYRSVFSYPYFNLVQSSVIEDALYSDKSMVVCAPTGSGKTVVFEMAIVQLLMELEDKNYTEDFKIIYMAPVKAVCTERLTEWYPKFTKFGLLCIEVTGDTDVDFSQLKPYRIIITTPEKWDMLTRRWRDHRGSVEVIKLFLIDEVHILNDETRGPVLEAVVSRMKTIEASSQSAHRIEQLKKQYQENNQLILNSAPRIRFVAVSATVSNPEDVAAWLGTKNKPAVFYKFGDECRPVKLKRIVEGYPCPTGTSIFKFDIVLNYKLWPIIQKYHNGKPTLIFCNTRKSVLMTAETLSKEFTINFTPEQKSRITTIASTIKNKKLQSLVLCGVGCHHAGLLYEERVNIENAFRNRDLPILITTTTLAMGVNLPAHLVIIKNTQQYVNGGYQEYSISTVLQMVGRAGRPQFDTEATAVVMTRLSDKPRYQALVGGSEPLQSYLHKRLAENLNSEAALGTVGDVAQCVQWLHSTFLYVRAARDPRRYLGIQPDAPSNLIYKKIEELCVIAMNGLARSGLITMDEASCIESTEAGRLMSSYYVDLETMKHIIKIEGSESLEKVLWIICESHELADLHLRVDERRCLNALNRNNAAATIRFPMKGKISTRQMKLNCIIQAVLGCLPIPDPSLNQEAMKVMRIADRICKCLVAYVTRPDHISKQLKYFSAVLNTLILAKSIAARLWENSKYVSKQLKGIGPAFSTLLASAGKVNFMLLEESHPRDLERIMNKSAPAGNILRKQISLLPKYQLTVTPISNDKVSIQLRLLNHAHLAENMEQLTAGETHKCHIVVGDSENHILLLTCFKDKDLIGIYNGTITYEITRKHNCEHKVFVHCISSNFVGLDVQSEYLFKGLEPLCSRGESIQYPAEPITKKAFKKQTTITDTFKERKRKPNYLDISHSKEKKKRDNTVIDKFRQLRESFVKTSINSRNDLHKSAEISNTLLQETMPSNNQISDQDNNLQLTCKDNYDYGKIEAEHEYPEMIAEDLDNKQYCIADEHIDKILNEIEKEISESRHSDRPQSNVEPTTRFEKKSSINQPNYFTKPNYIPLNRKRPTNPRRCNYNFIELLERNENLSDEDDPAHSQDGGFTDTIKSHIENFLMKTSTNTTKPIDPVVTELLSNPLYTKFPDAVMETGDSCINDVEKLENNKEIDKDTTLTLKPIEDLTMSPEEPGSQKEHDNDKSKYPEIKFGTCSSNKDINPIPKVIFEKNNQNDVLREEFYGSNLENSINQRNYVTNDVQETIEPEMCGHYVEKKSEPTYCIKDILTGPCNLKKLEPKTFHSLQIHKIVPNKCSQINNQLTTILEDRENGYSEESKDLIVDIDCANTQEKNIHDINLSLIQSNNNFMLPNYNIMTMNTCASNASNSDNKLHQALVVESDRPEKSPILYSEGRLGRFKFFNEISKQFPLPLPYYNTTEEVNTNALTLSSLKNTKDDSWENFKLNNDVKSTATSKEASASFLPHNSKKDKYVNKYSFSTTKVDVQTKKHADVEVHIVRKLKVDLDVTEILTRKNTKDQKNEGKSDKTINFADKSMSCALVPYYSQKCMTNGDTHEEEGVWPELIYETDNNDRSLVLEKSVPRTDQRANTQDVIQKDATQKELTIVQEQTLENSKDKLGNILLKYSKILRKSGNLQISTTKEENNVLNVTSKTAAQSSRPYKIKDINKLDISLPPTIIMNSAPEEVKPNKDDIIARIKALKQNNENFNAIQPSSIYRSIQQDRDKIIPQVIDEDYEDMALDETLPKTSNLETVDFDIDQYMFDPKILLQCLSKDDDASIAPPPPEFRNDESLVQNTKTTHKPFGGPANIFDGSGENRSIFDKDTYSVLTPSKEIETWTFSRDDNTSIDLNESCTVMRINSPTTSATTYVPQRNRKTKLNKFCFKGKNKLKM